MHHDIFDAVMGSGGGAESGDAGCGGDAAASAMDDKTEVSGFYGGSDFVGVERRRRVKFSDELAKIGRVLLRQVREDFKGGPAGAVRSAAGLNVFSAPRRRRRGEARS
jgi:hypothetical protein